MPPVDKGGIYKEVQFES